MSADNWTTCPRCAAERQEEIEKLDQSITESYGKVSVDEFDNQRSKLSMHRALPLDRTWREDYEFYGADEGSLHISYSGGCSVCGLSHKVDRVEQFWPVTS
jgi:hypothetical protein